MAEAITLGRMTDTMEEGFVAELHIKTGDQIKAGDAIAEIETDKATLPLESFFNGEILHVAAKQGDTLKIGDLIAIIGKHGEDYTALLNQPKATQPETDQPETTPAEQKPVPPAETKTADTKPEVTPTVTDEGRIKASPLARMIAREKGVDLSKITGTGEDGRIVKRDLEQVAASGPAVAAFVDKENSHDVRVSQMRKTIARRLSESKYSAPHFYLTIDVNMDNAVSLRTQLNQVLPAKVSFNDMVIKAAAFAIRQSPDVNCSWMGDVIRYHDHIHIGMAVAVDEGLLVPVIKFVDGKSLQQIATETKSLAQKVTSKKIQPHEMEGNTFTISNLGMFGIDEFTAIINPPDACILAVGAIRQELALADNQVKAVQKMKLTLSCDHRAVDGAKGAKFLQVLKHTLENPVSLLL